MPGLWFRCYIEITRDRKLRRLPVGHRWTWIAILAIAKASPKPGWLLLSEGVPVTAKDISDEAAIPVRVIVNSLDAFSSDLHMLEKIDGVWHVVNWDKRQFNSDVSTERVKRHRSKAVSETFHIIKGNVAETPPESESDTETDKDIKHIPPSASPAVSVGQASKEPYAADFEIFWKAYPRKKEKQDAFKVWRQRVKEGQAPDDLTRAAQCYADECRRKGTAEDYIKHAATFLGPKVSFAEYLKPGQPLVKTSGLPDLSDSRQQLRMEIAQEEAAHNGH